MRNYRLLIMFFLLTFSGCKKVHEDIVTPVIENPVTEDPRPVEGNWTILVTDTENDIGVIKRVPKLKVDVMAAGEKDSAGFLIDVTSVLMYNPNSKAWVVALLDKGYPVKIALSTGYLATYKNYDKATKTVEVTLSLNEKVIKEAYSQKLSDSFFANVAEYEKLKNGRGMGTMATECERFKKAASRVGTAGNAIACAGGAVFPPAGLIGGLGFISACYGALDGIHEEIFGTSLSERMFGKEGGEVVKGAIFAGSFLNAKPNPSALGEAINKGLGYLGKATDGSGYVPCGKDPSSPRAHSTGDPHLTTLDGLRYDFQGHGEFIVVKSSTDNFEIQARQEDAYKKGNVTLNTAVAVRVGADVICLTAKPDRFFINNQPQNWATFTTQALKDGGSVTKVNTEMVNVKNQNGDVVSINFHGSYLLDYSVSLAENRIGKVSGLLGNFDGNANNDIAVRDGNILSGRGSVSFKEMYPVFADSWRIQQSQSLFYYDSGKNTASYTIKDFPKTLVRLTPEQAVKAEGICRAAGVTTEPFLSACIFDVGVTDDASLVSSSLWAQGQDSRPPGQPLNILPEAIDIKTISTRNSGTFLLKSDGTLWAAGWARHGQFGIGKNDDYLSDHYFDSHNHFVQIMDGIKDIATGVGSHMLFLKNDNSVWAAGYNSVGQVGNGLKDGESVLTAVKIMTDAKTLVIGTYHSLVLKNDNSLWGFGNNDSGQASGDGTKADIYKPVKIMDGVRAMSAGYSFDMIIKTDNTLWGLGANSDGQMGLTLDKLYSTLIPLKLMDNVKSVSTGEAFSAVLKTDNSLWVTGRNTSGQLGDGTFSNSVGAFKKLADNVMNMAAGTASLFFIKTDNTLWATGKNESGQLGDGTNDNRNVAGRIMADVKYVTTGSTSTFIVKTDQTLWATGENLTGQLGDGTDDARNVFVPIVVK
jgi:alpha-tubulin suppressor-like RCC1 family protein